MGEDAVEVLEINAQAGHHPWHILLQEPEQLPPVHGQRASGGTGCTRTSVALREETLQGSVEAEAGRQCDAVDEQHQGGPEDDC